MKKSLLLAIFLSLFNVFLPVIISSAKNSAELSDYTDKNQQNEKKIEQDERKTENAIDSSIVFKVQDGENVIKMKMNEYLIGVLAAEIPASFPMDALKAQAVAARSFILYRLANPPTDGVHDNAAICTEPSHCKGYKDILSQETAQSLYGAAAQIYIDKFEKAVSDTDGEVMVYDGGPILAAFHSISGGKTENASDVWGGNVPYLTSVDSPGEEEAKKYESTAVFSIDEYKERLEKLCGEKLTGEAGNWINSVERSEAGGVISAMISGKTFKGTAIRTALELNSTDFIIDIDSAEVVIYVKGYGHGVGMSQYGARAMALEGNDYKEILTHYYNGAALKKIDKNSFDK